MPGKLEAAALLISAGLKRKAARELLDARAGHAWSLTAKDGKTVLVTPLSRAETAVSEDSADPHKQRGFFERNAAGRMNSGRPHSETQKANDSDRENTAVISTNTPRAREGNDEVRL
jgi:hypothetical protein